MTFHRSCDTRVLIQAPTQRFESLRFRTSDTSSKASVSFAHHYIKVCYNKMRLSAFLCFTVISMALTESVNIKSLVFSAETDTSYVEMVPQKPLAIKAFTLCMRVATELKGEREVILFAYRTPSSDELNVWRELNGRLSLYLSGDGVMFDVPQLGALETHLCVTWDSSSGATTLFMDGKKSLTKIYRKGHAISPSGRVVLGQDLDSFQGGFDIKQSFVGEICDVNMWDSVLSDSNIQDIFSGKRVPRGNVFDWEITELQIHGEVDVVKREL